jgi:hypothetical protein
MTILAGQSAKYTRNLNIYRGPETDAAARQNAVQKMAEVIVDAPSFKLTEADVTRGQEVPDAVREHIAEGRPLNPKRWGVPDDYEPEPALSRVDTTGMRTLGEGSEAVYVFGYDCASGRCKIGYRQDGDYETRVREQMNSSAPGRPKIFVVIQTDDCRSLEKYLHGYLGLCGRRIKDAPTAEWFETTGDEIVEIYHRHIKPLLVQPA